MRRLAVLTALMLCGLAPATAGSAAVPAGAQWTQTNIPTPDGEQLHAEVLKPKGLAAGARTPVIAIVSPYLGHAAEAGNDGAPAPSERFSDFFKGAKVFERGYSVV